MKIPQQNSQLIDKTMERVSDAVITANEDMECTYLNSNAKELIDATNDTLRGESLFDTLPHPLDTIDIDKVEKVQQTEETQSFVRYNEALDRWYEVSVYPDEDGISIFITDISDQKESERELQRVQQRFEEFSRSVREAFFQVSADYEETLYVNPAVETVYGITPQEATKDPLAWLRHVHPDDRDDLEANIDEQMVKEVDWPVEQEFRVQHPVRGEQWVKARLDCVSLGDSDEHIITGTAIDITDKKRQERELERSEKRVRAIFDHAPDEIYLHDAEGNLRDVNLAAVDNLGYSREELLSMSVSDFVSDRSQMDLKEVFREMSAGETYRAESQHEQADGTTYPVEVWLNKVNYDDTERFVGICRDVSAQRQQAKSLAELHNASQDLVEAQEREEVFDRLLGAAITITGVDSATLFQFEETENTLLPTNSFGRETSPVSIEPGQGPRWKAFADQATRVLEPGPKTHVRDDVSTLLILSLGDRCVLQCVSEKPEALDEQQRELVETLVAMAEAVLNRTTRERQLRRREAQLQSQSAVADRLERVNGIIRRLSREFVNIRTREALDTTVCESLCDVDEFEFVWFGMVGNGVVKPVATSGDHSDYLEAQAPVETTRREKSLPAGRAAVTEDVVIIEKIADEIHDGEWQTKALAQSLLSVVSIPVKHNGVRYGILTLYANQANTFGENMKTVLQELADIVACACYRIEQERASRYNRERRVDFTVKTAQTPLLSVAEKIGSKLSVLSVKRTHLTTTAYIESPDANPSDCVSAGKTTAGIDAVQSTGPSTYRYRVEADEVGLVEMITECGGIVESIATIEDTLQVQARFPDTDATDSICTVISDKCDGVTIAQARPTADSTHYTEELFDELTDRQYEALQMAFQYGYFSWPKQSTGEDVAEEMGVAPSTFTEHVRRAESALLTKLLAYEARSP